jgi:hypothetical protein
MDVEFSVWPMDGKLLKSSFQWFKFQVVWSSLRRVMAIVIDRDQLKGCCLEFSFYYMFLLRILRVISKIINRFVFCCKQVREKRKSVREIENIIWIEKNFRIIFSSFHRDISYYNTAHLRTKLWTVVFGSCQFFFLTLSDGKCAAPHLRIWIH